MSGAAGLASIGAGSIHAAAAAAHADAAPAMVSFAVLALCQIVWGALALGRIGNRLILAGALGNLLALTGWLSAKVAGIGFVPGLEHAEPVQLADSLAAVLGAIAVACAFAAVASAGRAARPALGSALTATFAVAVAAAAVAGVTATSGHAHGDADERASSQHVAAGGDGPDRVAGSHHDAVRRIADGAKTARTRRSASIDLGGVDGVTRAQRARAERLVAVTRRRLPRFASVAAAEAAGYVSIGDAPSGHEHFVKWSYVNDDKLLDPTHAESLVYRVRGDDRKLVAAMYMLSEGATLDTVPDVGGRLTQWHVHDDLCFTDDSGAPVVAGIVEPGGACPPPLVKRARVPMLHVWIVPHDCGPFAALEGIAGGQVRGGQPPRCEHRHGGR